METYCGYKRKSDAKITISLDNDGIDIIIISKFKDMFGSHIKRAIMEVLNEEHIQSARVIVEDDGALDFVIRARTRTAIKRLRDY